MSIAPRSSSSGLQRAVQTPWRAWLTRVGWWGGRGHGGAVLHRWVRLGMYSVLLIVAGLSAWQAWRLERSEEVRSLDAEVIRVAATQNALTHRIGLLAAMMTMADEKTRDRGHDLSDALTEAQTQAGWLDELLTLQGVWRDGADPKLRQVIFQWQDSRERLWYRAQILLWYSDAMNPTHLRDSVRVLQAEIEPSTEATQHLIDQLQRAAQSRARGTVEQMQFAAVAMLLLMLALIAFVAEPLARFVRRQHRALIEQATEIERLALVAQRTTNWVALLDAQRRVVWANEAFLQARRAELADVLGRLPGLLENSRYLTEQELEGYRGRLREGLGLRAELLYTLVSGQEIWLDADVQPIHDTEGVLTGFTLVATDITERVTQRLKTQAMLDALPAGVVLRGVEGAIVECNSAAAHMVGIDRAELLGRVQVLGDGACVHDDLTPYPQLDQPAFRTLRTGLGVRGENMGVRSATGEFRWLIVNTEPMHDVTGRMDGVVICAVDVTEQRAQKKLFELAIDGADLGLWQWDVATGNMTCNDRLLELYGYRRDTLAMDVDVWNAMIHPDDLPGWRWAIKSNLRDSERALRWEIRIRHGESGRWIWMMYSGTVVARDAHGRALRMAGICYDINAQKELEEQLVQAARTDALTQLPNRSELLRRIQASLLRVRQTPGYYFAVLFMDFDRFKQVNDTLGHGVGDELLRQIAHRLQESLRPGDSFVQTSDYSQMAARIGGDEFVVVLDDIRGDLDAHVVASRLLDVLGAPYQIGLHQVRSSVSIGVVTTEHMAEDPDSVLRDADIAMYEAKREGRARYVMFEPSMRKRLRDDVSLENDLRHALEQGQLHVVYQPLVELATGKLAGMEALVRWRHAQRGLVSPLVFVPVAEATGLISTLGKFVLRRACEEFVRLQDALDERAPPSMSVNLSRAQLREPGLVSDIMDVLRDTGLNPAQLILEVTESLAAQDEVVQTTLAEISALGITLSLDDFGTGYSSLSCLHQLPVDVVKIDRSFVSQALESAYHRVMIEATIRMAQTLGLRTVAEGIETPEQAGLMLSLGCDKGQGYLYSPPLAMSELIDWIAGHEAPTCL